MAVDPICHMQVDESSPRTEAHDGQTYWFCSDHCRHEFRRRLASGESIASIVGKTNGSSLPVVALGHAQAHHDHAQHAAHAHLAEAAAPQPSSTDRIYYCPMDEGVEQIGPGICPKCGMALVPKPGTDAAEEDDTELTEMTRRFWIALALGIPVFLLAMLPMLGVPTEHFVGSATSNWLQALLTTPIVLWAGWPFFVRGYRSLVSRNLNMFTLIALGIAAAYGDSVVALLAESSAAHSHQSVHLYFEAAAAITVLVLLGQVLELRARRQTSSAIRELLSLAPPDGPPNRAWHGSRNPARGRSARRSVASAARG